MSSSTSPESPKSTAAGASLYSRPGILSLFYDFVVLRLSNTFVWRCPTATTLLPFFTKHSRSSARHLDIGVGTGYYLAHAGLKPNVELVLCDLNPDALTAAKGRVVKSRGGANGGKVETLLWDVEKPLPERTDEGKKVGRFDSISLMYLLHCMPGPVERKVAIFQHLKDRLVGEGVLFGSTVLGKGVRHNFWGRWLMGVYNRKGIFGNEGDGVEVFVEGLRKAFEKVEVEVVGCVLLFVGRRPRK